MHQPGNKTKEIELIPGCGDIFSRTILKRGNRTESAENQDYTPSCDNNSPA